MNLITRLSALITTCGGDLADPKVAQALGLLQEYFSGLKAGQMKLLREEFAGTYWNENITDENFPGADANVSIDGVRPVKIGRAFTREEAIIALKAMTPPMKPARLDKSIRWCAANPDYQRTHWMLCLAQSWVDAGGVEYVVCFRGIARRRDASLDGVAGRWSASGEVLAEEE